MKVERIKTQILLDDVSNQYSFKLESSEIFRLLTSKLYSNPLRTMLQEYITNARDIHRKTKQTKPIDIFFDNLNQIHIRDYGTGLSEEMIRNVFIYFGRSTKRDTNEQIGGFGIGAKSAFAYTDTFTIVNRYNGIKETYIATIKDEIPTLIEINREETDEENGLEIIIPIKPDDVNIAKDYVFDLVLFWYKGIFSPYDKVNIKFRNKHNNTIDEYYNDIIVVNTPEYAITKSSRYYKTITIEGIPYEDQTEIISLDLFVPHFKVGEIKIANNRENIMIDNIEEINSKIIKKLEKAVKNEPIKNLTYIYARTPKPITRNKYISFDVIIVLNANITQKGSIRNISIPGTDKVSLDNYKLFIYDNSISEFRGIIGKIQTQYNLTYINAMSRDMYNKLLEVEPGIIELINVYDINTIKEKNTTSTVKNNNFVPAYYLNNKLELERMHIDREKIPKMKTKLIDYELPTIIYAKNKEEIVNKIYDLPSSFRMNLKFITRSTRIKKEYNLLTIDEFINKYNEILDKLFVKYKKKFFKFYIKSRMLKPELISDKDNDAKLEMFYNTHQQIINSKFNKDERTICSILENSLIQNPNIYPSFIIPEIETIRNKTIKYLKDNFDIEIKF